MLRRPFRYLIALLGLLALLPLAATPAPAAAQRNERCFPETGFCISGPILNYWQNNGGLPVFGYPITEQRVETVEGRTIPVQWFERDRLEIQNDGTITAGRLGARLLELQGRPWERFTRERPNGSLECSYFPQTGFNACGWFLGYWQRNGGLERFGYPISPVLEETIEGRTYSVQYFERRRMEYHPENSYPYDVLLGLLGREVYQLERPVGCAPAIAPLASLAQRLRAQVGCPTAGARGGVAIAVQEFENGRMVWVANEDVSGGVIYVITSDLTSSTGRIWRSFPDTYVEGEPVNTDVLPPPGKFIPVRGFGKLWRDNDWVRGALGFASGPERADHGAVQPFEGGKHIMVYTASTNTALVLGPLRNSGAAGEVWEYEAR
jgi:hypothetical protein